MNRKRLIVAYLIWRKLKHRRNRSTYMRPILMDNRARCELFWLHYNSTDEEELRNFCSFSRLQFDQLYNILKDGLKKSGTHAFPIKPQERLAIFLRFMATGLSYSKLGQEFSIGGRTVNLIVDYVSRLVIIRLEKTVFPPITQEMWLKNAEEFERRFYFPNCVAAIDKKHFSAMCPPKTGDNSKNFFSIFLLAVCDPWCRFIMVDIGSVGPLSDSSIYTNSAACHRVFESEHQLPPSRQIGSEFFPYVILADGSFGSKNYMVTPYEQAQVKDRKKLRFNERLFGARNVVVERTFENLTKFFDRVKKPMEIKRPEQAMNIIYTAVILHNFLINTDDSINTLQTPNVDTNSKRGYGVDPRNMCRLGRPNTLNDEVKITRENFVDLFSPD